LYREFTFEDSLSKAGGLLGLLAGASILSIIEFVYFILFTIFPLVLRLFKKKPRKQIRKSKDLKILYVKEYRSGYWIE
jgi:hypothetical protein